MMTTTMAVWAQRHGVCDLIRAFFGERLNVVNFQIRQIKLLKRSWLAAAIAMTFGFISNPRSDFGITNINRARACRPLRFFDAFRRLLYLLLLKHSSATL